MGYCGNTNPNYKPVRGACLIWVLSYSQSVAILGLSFKKVCVGAGYQAFSLGRLGFDLVCSAFQNQSSFSALSFGLANALRAKEALKAGFCVLAFSRFRVCLFLMLLQCL